jgi:Icc-related predicted phosphoesterase
MVAEDAGNVGIPVAAVLGNHDHDSRTAGKIIDVLAEAGVQVLEGSGTVVTCRGTRLGVAGCKGYGGGFDGAVVYEHGEPQTRAFVRHSRDSAKKLATALGALDCDVKVALTHYAPIPGTLAGEPRELYVMLGSKRLGQVIDEAAVALAIHGHAHRGAEKGVTPGGTPVRNVAYKVIGTAYRIYTLRACDADRTSWQVIDHDG